MLLKFNCEPIVSLLIFELRQLLFSFWVSTFEIYVISGVSWNHNELFLPQMQCGFIIMADDMQHREKCVRVLCGGNETDSWFVHRDYNNGNNNNVSTHLSSLKYTA